MADKNPPPPPPPNKNKTAGVPKRSMPGIPEKGFGTPNTNRAGKGSKK